MKPVTKTFVVPTGWLSRRVPRFLSAVQKLNSRKYGGLRRGMVQLAGINATARDDGTTEVRVLTTPAPKKVQWLDGNASHFRKACLYDHDDIGKVMKDLTVASAKVK